MAAVECFTSSNERMVQFVCGPSETCCGPHCCAASGPFYTHWYFWLAVSMFLLVVVGVGVSACLHFRKQRKHNRYCLRTKPGFGADLLLNYHLTRTDGLHFPLYEDRGTRSQLHVTSLSATALPPPPPYTDIHSNSDWGQPSGEFDDQSPPSYSECVKQESLFYPSG